MDSVEAKTIMATIMVVEIIMVLEMIIGMILVDLDTRWSHFMEWVVVQEE